MKVTLLIMSGIDVFSFQGNKQLIYLVLVLNHQGKGLHNTFYMKYQA